MKKILLIISLFSLSLPCLAQLDIQCDGRDMHSIYIISTVNDSIYRVDSIDTNPTAPFGVERVPQIGNTIGIAISANLNASGGPTMYCVNGGGIYYYWNGTGWTNTGHFSGNALAVNPGGTSDFIFNYGNNTVYRYDGTGNAIPLVNFVPVFPDVATDSLGNFYLFDAFLEKIVAYTPSGIPIDTFYTTGSMGATGGGFALLGNRFYAESIYTLHEGIVVGDSVFFSVAVSHPTLHTNDLATCPVSGFPVAVFEYPELPHFAVFPNPATDIAYIRFENTLALKVYDQLGKQCRNISVEGLSEYQLDVEQLDQGVYFITAISKTNTTATMKLMVQ